MPTRQKESDSSMALNAMRRAAKEAIEKAAGLGLKIPVWKNGQIIFVKAEEQLQNLSCTSSCSDKK